MVSLSIWKLFTLVYVGRFDCEKKNSQRILTFHRLKWDKQTKVQVFRQRVLGCITMLERGMSGGEGNETSKRRYVFRKRVLDGITTLEPGRDRGRRGMNLLLILERGKGKEWIYF